MSEKKEKFEDKHPILFMFISGLVITSFSLWLMIIPFIGIPMLVIGLLMMIASPFSWLGAWLEKRELKKSEKKK